MKPSKRSATGTPDPRQRATALDSSIIIAALLRWHDQHSRARELLELAFDRGPIFIPSRALVESFSVMTRLPAPHRLSPSDAFDLLAANFEAKTGLTGLRSEGYWEFLKELAAQEVAGGVAYDAEIAHAAAEAGCQYLVTLNRRHFERVAPDSLQVESP